MMKIRDLLDLMLLGVLWGMSFLFVRVAAPEFGAVALIEVRVVMAALMLLPLLVAGRGVSEVRRHWRGVALMGILHYALPFCLFAYSMLTLTGGYSAIINASSPLFAAAVAWVWLGERLPPPRMLGLMVGLAGVVILVWHRLEMNYGSVALVLAVGASVLASFCYGLAAVMARKRLTGISPLALSGGSMLVAAVALLPFAWWFWPEVAPSPRAWAMALALGGACTALAFVVYFRLIASVGPTRAITVTFLIPVFAVLFGALFIGETLTPPMVVGGVVILLGTAMSTVLGQPKGAKRQ